MGSDIPKVMLEVAGRPMVAQVADTLRAAGADPICVIVPAGNSPVRALLGQSVSYAAQEYPTGTGDAVAAAQAAVGDAAHLLVACGDSPLFRQDTVRRLMCEHIRGDSVATLTTATLDNPSGYGRIVRDHDGQIAGVVEEAVASPEEKRIAEVNGGLYAFRAAWLWGNLARPAERMQEFVLTEVISRAVEQRLPVLSTRCGSDEVAGVNTPEQLEAASRILLQRARC